MKRGNLISSVLATLGIVMISIALVIQSDEAKLLQEEQAVDTTNSTIQLKNMATSANTIINSTKEENPTPTEEKLQNQK